MRMRVMCMRMCRHMFTCMRVHVHVHARVRACMHACVRACVRVCVRRVSACSQGLGGAVRVTGFGAWVRPLQLGLIRFWSPVSGL